MSVLPQCTALLLFFFNDTATTEIYTLSLHDALPISRPDRSWCGPSPISSTRLRRSIRRRRSRERHPRSAACSDRKSTRLNSSHLGISYAVFCLKKKTQTTIDRSRIDELNS